MDKIKNSNSMKYFILISIFCLFFLFSFNSCQENEFKIQKFDDEDKKNIENINAYNEFQFYYNLWKKNGIKSYHFKIIYIARSPTQGIWEIWVKENKVVKILSNTGIVSEGKSLSSNNIFSSLTIDSLFSLASYSYKNSLKSTYKTTVKYNQQFGFPEEIKKIPATKDAPKDQGFAYLVLFFEPIQ